MKLLAAEVAADLGNAGLVHASLGRPSAVFDGVCTDTRQDPAGKLFIALQGERFDAHDFVSQALAAGAGGVVVAADARRQRSGGRSRRVRGAGHAGGIAATGASVARCGGGHG